MPPMKIHASNAERQAAYRARHREREPVRQGLLAGLARSLHGTLAETVREGRSRLPPELLGRRADETLQKLIRYLQAEEKEPTQRTNV
jgi:hypothetical protein